ncbi:MAG: polyphosphate kinase 1 [Crocinitomicaceae bacterium]|nr:polyphosphate kinase 1 [Crocinitomicaceae bacterium]
MLEVLEYISKPDLNKSGKFMINREISWLAFNARVLQEAEDPNVPLIERMRFLGIFSNNLDEFFKVRVATVKRMIHFKKSFKDALNVDPRKLLQQIQEKVLEQQAEFQRIYNNLLDELEKEGIHMVNETELNADQGEFVKDYFNQKVWPTLVPLMIDDKTEFPTLRDKSIYLAIKLYRSDNPKNIQYSLLEVPSRTLPRFLVIPSISDRKYIIFLDDVIRYCLKEVYAILNYDQFEAYTIKITRDAELDIDEDVSKSFLEKMKKSLKQRKKGEPVRFVYDETIPNDLLKFMKNKLELDSDDNLIPGGRYHNSKDFMAFPNLGRAELEYEKFQQLQHRDLKPYESILDVIGQKDVLLHYPFQSFGYFIDLLREAAIDPKVKSIKITIYRLAKDSRVINALINAAKNGKKVTVVLELQARFDEEANIKWSNVLQDEGVKVLFGIPGLKVHSKLCVISRKEANGLKHYASIGTGNYNEKTAKIYSDLSLFTSDKRITAEANRLFKMFDGITHRPFVYRHIVPSPTQLRNRLIRLISNEIKLAKDGKEAYITLKMNSLVDQQMIEKLYQASMAGVKIRLIIRGICSLVPNVEGLSENIEAISIVDKFLEHARVFIFGNGGNEVMYISSADWMGRNLDNRVEVTCPIYDPRIKQEINDFLNIQWRDNVKARIHDGSMKNEMREPAENEKLVRSQFELYEYYKNQLKEGE